VNWSCFEIGESGHLSSVDGASVVKRWRDGEGPFWIDVESPDREDRGRVLSDLGISQGLVDELLESGHAPRVLPLDEALCFEFPTQISGDPPELKSILLVCIERLIVTFHEMPSRVPAESRAEVVSRIAFEGGSTSELLCALLVASSIDLRRRCADLREAAVSLSRRMEADPAAVELVEVLDLKREIVDLDGATEERAVILEMVGSLKHPVFDLTQAVGQFRVAVGNTAATARRLDRLDRRAGDLQARYDAYLLEKTNRRLSRLTIISAIFLPLTLLAGIYGMNFDTMPELHHPLGYPLALGGMVLVAVGMFWWFRSRGWME
jgi:magnesium transporter